MLHRLELGDLHEALSGRRLAASACLALARARATALRRLGVTRGQRVFIHYGSQPEFFTDLLGVWLAGGCCVPLDPRLTSFEIDVLARTARPMVSIWDGIPAPDVREMLAGHGIHAIERSERGPEADTSEPLAWPEDTDDALILFTSGTTGAPKGVVQTHGALRERWRRQRETLGTDTLDRTLCLLPTNFAWGLIGNALYAWLSGRDLYLAPALRSDVLLQLGRLCDEHAITYLPTVPSMWRMVVKMVAPPGRGSLRRVTCGTSPLPASLWRSVQQWSGTSDVMHVYSMTECGMVAAQSAAVESPEDGLVGRPFPGTQVRIVSPDTPIGEVPNAPECRVDEAGMLCVRTATLMRGYFERPDLTAAVMQDGWFMTGDLASRDDIGRLFLRGREKELINVGGIKVYPADVDVVIERSGYVSDVCTFGEADPLQGEQVAVAVSVRDAANADLTKVHEWARRHLASYQLPRRWFVLADIPRNARGKLDRHAVARACAGLKPADTRARRSTNVAGAPG